SGGSGNPVGHRVSDDLLVQLLSPLWGQQFGVGDALQLGQPVGIVERQNDGGGDDRAGNRAPTGLVQSGDGVQASLVPQGQLQIQRGQRRSHQVCSFCAGAARR